MDELRLFFAVLLQFALGMFYVNPAPGISETGPGIWGTKQALMQGLLTISRASYLEATQRK